MSQITKINLQKSKKRANIYLDNVFCCGLDNETVVKYGLQVGKEISVEELQNLQMQSELNKAFEKSLSLLEKQLYTKHNLKQKLKQKGYLPQVIDSTIDKLIEYGYINDSSYAKSYISSYKLKSKKELLYNLKQKGIKDSDIINHLDDITNEDEQASCELLAQKYLKNKQIDDKILQKLFNYLAGKGYPFDIIKPVINKYRSNIIDD